MNMFQPTWWSNWMSMYFPKRLELSFFRVLAFPKACKTVKQKRPYMPFSKKWSDPTEQLWQTYIPRALDWRAPACPGRCSEVWCLDSWQRRIAGFSWRPQSCRPHSPLRSGWSDCWTQTAWCGRRCLPAHNWKYSHRSESAPFWNSDFSVCEFLLFYVFIR